MSKGIQLKLNNENYYPHPYFPVGSIYLSINNTNPTTWFGGTWELIAKGRTLVGVDPNDADFNTVSKTGGSKTHQHLTPMGFDSGGYLYGYADNDMLPVYGSQVFWNINRVSAQNLNMEYNVPVRVGATSVVSSMQPYYTCYIWCRTA